MVRVTYTKGELLALRETWTADAYPDPLPPDCPMHTDINVQLPPTMVRKRRKSDRAVQLRRTVGDADAAAAAAVGVGGPNEAVRLDTRWGSLGGCNVVTQQGEPGRARECKDPDELWSRVIRPPRLKIPIVTIDRRRIVRDNATTSASGEHRNKTLLDIDTERKLVARLRVMQQQQLQQQQLYHPGSLGMRLSECDTTHAGNVELATPPAFRWTAVSHCSSDDAAAPVEIGGQAASKINVDTAVPISNVSLFNSVLGSRYFQFTRPLGMWNYLSGFFGAHRPRSFGFGVATHQGGVDFANSTSNASASGHQSSIGLDESSATPAGVEKGEEEAITAINDRDTTVAKKRSHRRRTNRTHAEKREYRRLQELRMQQAAMPCAAGEEK
ncbi:hypothetical protein DQ04_09281030 [Trypanosoma grayi]|uniref:hypothetical protein n=1 Tax=Trypanosoma grayi TaxID=71804 RepID=UPI0004F46CBD|nr:hypothetical protein DQ04_09281030 [Trypanosoma grayi]KEG07615.1 hypothetical protein DQ04_09281030 [Trypanosoma grayi]